MRKHALFLATFIFCALAIFPTAAQNGGWTAWLYSAADGHMTQVDDSGAVHTDFTLPLPIGFDLFPQKVAVGHGGSPFAYVVSNSTTFQGALVISQGAALKFSFNLPLTFADSTEFVADESIFNEDNSALALGYSLDGGGWGLLIFDLTSGTVAQTIRFDTPTVAVLGLSANFGLTPIPRRFIGREVTFSMIQAGTDAAPGYDAYTWNIDTGDLTQNLAFPSLDADTFPPTGEMVMSLPDDRLPNQSADFTFFQANTLHVFDPLTSARFPFYNSQTFTFSRPHFIQNGERILFEVSAAAGDSFEWQVVGRDGTLVGPIPGGVTINDAHGLGDGFIYTTDTFSPGSTTLVYVNTRDTLNAGVPIWSSNPNETVTIAWAGDTVIRAQAAYSPWAKLADAVYAPGVAAEIGPAGGQPLLTPGAISPSDIAASTPVFGRFLSVGGLAIINTTEGDTLNVRTAPTRDSAIATRLPDGERVTIMDGPRAGEGFTWWKIRTAAGIEGWVVESVDDNGSRLQTLIPE
ncbi:MAG: SH3 domain-containing protein [Chloroflexota bacterium]